MKTGGIIVEGAEQQGKSTFCNKLSEALGLRTIHNGYVRGKFDYFSGYFKDIDAGGGPFIYDRSYMSELVYGKYFGRKNIDSNLKKKIEGRFKDLNYFLVLLELDQPWIDREETVTREQNESIKSIYKETYDSIGIDKFLIKPSDDALQFILQQYKIRR